MDWTQKPPTKPGVYLNAANRLTLEARVIVVRDPDEFPATFGGWWLGPLDYPVPPGGLEK